MPCGGYLNFGNTAMAEISVDAVLAALGDKVTHALEETLDELGDDPHCMPHEALRVFRSRLRHRCDAWEAVPDDAVRATRQPAA